MNTLIIGYGKMGKEVENCLSALKHNIAGIVDNEEELNNFSAKADVAIEFSTPQSVVSNLLWCFEKKIPVVTGTTGWFKHLNYIIEKCKQQNSAILWGSNFSIGMNIFFILNNSLSKIMNIFEQYKPSITEIHHIHKLDKPSGTALTLADTLINNISRINSWQMKDEQPEKNVVSINAVRQGEIFGNHEVIFESEYDIISIEHIAKSRRGFAFGAIAAAQWLMNKQGIFSFTDVFFDVFNLNKN